MIKKVYESERLNLFHLEIILIIIFPFHSIEIQMYMSIYEVINLE